MTASGWYPGPGESRRRRLLVLVGLLGLVFIAVIGVLIALSNLHPSPTSTPRPEISSPTPATSPTSNSSAVDPDLPTRMFACPWGASTERDAHPRDESRVYGGGLSFPVPPGSWRRKPGPGNGFSFARDVGLIDQPVGQERVTSLVAGEVSEGDGFREPKQAAMAIWTCIAHSQTYPQRAGLRLQFGQAVTVDGDHGWRIRAEIRFDAWPWPKGDVLDIWVINTGEPGVLSFFAGRAPMNDDARIAALDATVYQLRVE